jgi:hypothetical protein
VNNKCLVCEKELTQEEIEHSNGTCSEYCNAVYSGYPMPHSYSVGLQNIIDNIEEVIK